jgi:hypothetical protein
MRRVVLFLIVLLLAGSTGIPGAEAASFAENLQAFRTRNAESTQSVQMLTAGLRAEQQIARTQAKLRAVPRILNSEYQRSLRDLSLLVRRVVRDQRTADRLLSDILVLQKQHHENAAVLLLKRSAVGQLRFMQTLARGKTLLQRCTDLRKQILAIPLRP